MTTSPRPQKMNYLGTFSLEVKWFKSRARTDFHLDEVEVIRQLIEKRNLRPIRFTTDFANQVELLDLLSPLAAPKVGEITINGMSVVIADRVGGGYSFVPFHNEDEVQVLGLGTVSSLSDGPMTFDQSEEILRFENLYWVEAQGDVTQRRTCVGRFSDPKAALAAAVDASTYFRFNTRGKLVCELDRWSQGE